MMFSYTVYQLLILLSISSHVLTELFSSSVLLRKSVNELRGLDIHESVLELQTIFCNESKEAFLYTLFKDIEAIHELIGDTEFTILHPIHAYKYIRLSAKIAGRLNDILGKVKEVPNGTNIINKFLQTLPGNDDFNGTVAGILRIHDTYRLHTKDIVNGVVGTDIAKPLTAVECFDFAVMAKELELEGINTLNISVQWLLEAKMKIINLNDTTIDVVEVLNAFVDIYRKAKCLEYSKEKRFYSKMQQDTYHEDPLFRCKQLRKLHKRSKQLKNFHALCRNEPISIPQTHDYTQLPRHLLHCRYSTQGDPRLIYQPVKLEELNKRYPLIAELHDIVNEAEIDFFKTVSHVTFKRGKVGTSEGTVVSPNKISQTTIIKQNLTDGNVKNLIGRLSALSGLDIRGFEKVLVANYGIGGHYRFHKDGSDNELPIDSHDNRFFTMIMYLTDVVAGGQTCFIKAGICVTPKQGKVVLFRNFYLNGSRDSNALHTSCPVMLGEKWIAIQWVGKFHQEFTFPCSTDANE